MIVLSVACLVSVIVAATSPLVGAWASAQSFGVAHGGSAVHVSVKDKVYATFGGETVSAPLSRTGGQVFVFGDGRRMTLDRSGRSTLSDS